MFTTILDYAFADCIGFTSFEFPSTVITIQSNVHSGWTNLNQYAHYVGLTYITTGLFKGCINLHSFVTPDDVITVNNESSKTKSYA